MPVIGWFSYDLGFHCKTQTTSPNLGRRRTMMPVLRRTMAPLRCRVTISFKNIIYLYNCGCPCVCVSVCNITLLAINMNVLNFDKVSDVGSWWNFHGSFWRMIPITWHHLQVHQEPPCPPRLQEETWRTGGVLTGFLLSNLHETFREASLGCSLSSETITRYIRNLHVLQDSRKRLGGQVEFWQAFWCPIFMKLSGKLL